MTSPEQIPNCFYRISIKALVLNESRDKFLVVRQPDGWWDLPGGGLDWGMIPQEDLSREVMEEMGLKTTFIAEQPSYLFTGPNRKGYWFANILYETELESLDFTPSDECEEVWFVNAKNRPELEESGDSYWNVDNLLKHFDPKRHQR